jgi:hypothetical protein
VPVTLMRRLNLILSRSIDDAGIGMSWLRRSRSREAGDRKYRQRGTARLQISLFGVDFPPYSDHHPAATKYENSPRLGLLNRNQVR